MRRLLILLLGVMLTACGMGNTETAQGDNPDSNGSGGIVAGVMEPNLEEIAPFIYQYEVKNQTEKIVTLNFSSSQRFDYAVKSKEGKDVYLFSSVAMFLQVVGEEEVKQGESLIYMIDLSDLSLSPGEYILSAWMTPMEGKEFESSVEFVVE